jgi:indole-3-glycerol phosphate synthase
VLGQLCNRAALRAELLLGALAHLKEQARSTPRPPSLEQALREGSTVHVIAEIKRRSPSKGVIDDALDGPERARGYVTGGATAISVITEPDSFGGSSTDLVGVRRAIAEPVLKKDFHVHPAQVWEAAALGASALLLIVRALGPRDTLRLAEAAREANIEALFEVRDESELEWAMDAGARMIGVNRRDLETLILEDVVLAAVLPKVSSSCVAVAESGIRNRSDVIEAAELGADAVLVGSSLSATSGAPDAVRSLGGIPKRGRSG